MYRGKGGTQALQKDQTLSMCPWRPERPFINPDGEELTLSSPQTMGTDAPPEDPVCVWVGVCGGVGGCV